MVAMNCTPGLTSPNELSSPRKHSGASLTSIPEQNTAHASGRPGNASDDVNKHVNGGYSVQTGSSQPNDISRANHAVAGSASGQGNVSSIGIYLGEVRPSFERDSLDMNRNAVVRFDCRNEKFTNLST